MIVNGFKVRIQPMNFIRRVFFVLLLTAGGSLFAQDLLTLDDAVHLALEKNYQIKVLHNSVQISRNNAHAGNAGFLPRLDVIGNATYSDKEIQQAMGTVQQKATLNSAQLQLTYNLFGGFGGYFTLKNLKANAQAAALSARQNIEQTLLQVIRAYYGVAAAQEGLTIRSEALQVSRERLRRIENKAAYGQANKIDLLNARVDFNADTVAFMEAKLLLTESQRALNVLLGRKAETPFRVQPEVRFSPQPPFAELRKSALRNNAAFLLAQKNAAKEKYALRVAQSAYSPRVDLISTYGYSQYLSDLNLSLNNPDRNFTAGVTVSFNLFNGFKNKIQTQNAKIALKNQQLLLEQTRLSLEKDLANAFTAYRNKRYILKVEQASVQAAELNFKRSRELYDLGQLTATEFRAAQLNLIQARFKLAQAKYDAKNAEATLLQLSGKLVTEAKTH